MTAINRVTAFFIGIACSALTIFATSNFEVEKNAISFNNQVDFENGITIKGKNAG